MKIMKLVIATIVSIIIIAVLSSSVYAGTVSSVNTAENQGKITVSGTAEAGVLAVAVTVYSGDNLVYIETTNVNSDGTYNVELGKTFSDGKYTVKVADYNGGDYATKENVIVGNPVDDEIDEIEDAEKAEETANETTEESKVVENNEKTPQTGDIIGRVFIVLAVATAIFIITSKARVNKKSRKH